MQIVLYEPENEIPLIAYFAIIWFFLLILIVPCIVPNWCMYGDIPIALWPLIVLFFGGLHAVHYLFFI